jgi:hypothetical protein
MFSLPALEQVLKPGNLYVGQLGGPSHLVI